MGIRESESCPLSPLTYMHICGAHYLSLAARISKRAFFRWAPDRRRKMLVLVHVPSWHGTSPVLFRPHFSLSLCQARNIYCLFVPADAFSVAKKLPSSCPFPRETAAMIETMRLNTKLITIQFEGLMRALFPSVFVCR
jgi:hypothetical protein